MTDAILVFPPAYYPWFVPPGLSYLAAFVRQAGYSVVQRDANIGAIEFCLSPSQLRKTDAPDSIVFGIENALRTMRDATAYKAFLPYLAAKTTVEEASEYIDRASPDTFRIFRNTLQYISQFDARKRSEIVQAVESRQEHLFHDYFAAIEVPAIAQLAPRLVGLSVNDHHQLIPAFVLASMLKERLSNTHICLGGNLIPRILTTIEQDDEWTHRLFGYVDSFIHHEGGR